MTFQDYGWVRKCYTSKHTHENSDEALHHYFSENDDFENLSPIEFNDLEKIDCLVILGEPGIGKTIAMRSSYISTIQSGCPAIFFELGVLANHETLHREIFKHTTLLNWKVNGGDLVIYFDGLDECLSANGSAAIYLIDKLCELSVNGLKIRISCRSSYWSDYIQTKLTKKWGNDNVGVFNLAPLSLIDIINAAEVEGLDSKEFEKLLKHTKTYSLATRPLGLNFLISSIKDSGELPSNKILLYESGCKILCKESNCFRRHSGLEGRLTHDQRFIISARMAACVQFSNKHIININNSNNSEEIKISELTGDIEVSENQSFFVDENSIVECLSTGLFRSIDENHFVIAHPTFGEFLAASYLTKHTMPLDQIMSIIADPNLNLIPQLISTSVWIAAQNQDIFNIMIKNEPEVLLNAGIGMWDEDEKRKIVSRLLAILNDEKSRPEIPFNLLETLRFNGLGQLLKTWIGDSDASDVVKALAIDIAIACEIDDIENEILSVAVDKNVDIRARLRAFYYLRQYGRQSTKESLKPLVKNPGKDPNDELKGVILRTIWPEVLDIDSLFQSLTPPKNDIIGSYDIFLSYYLAKSLRDQDLPYSLKWALKNDLCAEGWKEKLIDSIIIRALEENLTDETGPILALLVLQRLKRKCSILIHSLNGNINEVVETEYVRQLVFYLTKIINIEETGLLTFISDPLFTNRDLKWGIDQMKNASLPGEKEIWAQLVVKIFQPSDNEQLQLILESSEGCKELNEAYLSVFGPVVLDSLEAKRAKEQYELLKDFDEKRKLKRLDPSPSERVQKCLDNFESGNLDMWWKLNRELTLSEYSIHYGNELEGDLTKLPGWALINDCDHHRVLAAAKLYLTKYDYKDFTWFGENKLYYPAAAGYRALLLIKSIEPEWFKSTPKDMWNKWLTIIIDNPFDNSWSEGDNHRFLLEQAYIAEKQPFLHLFSILAIKESLSNDHPFLIQKIEYLIDLDITNILLKIANNKEIKLSYLTGLLTILLKHQKEEAQKFGIQVIQNENEHPTRIVAVAVALIKVTSKETWPQIWEKIITNEKMGKEVFELLCGNMWFDDQINFNELSDSQIGELYIWLSNHYPPEEDPPINGFVTFRHNLIDLRMNALKFLVMRGTEEACNIIDTIRARLPNHSWLGFYAQEAQKNARLNNWRPLTPHEIISLVTNNVRCLIRNEVDLQKAILNSMKRLEGKMQGETPSAYDLWNELTEGHRKQFRPKDENALSDYVKRHLDLDLPNVVLSRETEIRRGERTDIHVDTIVDQLDGKNKKISVIIEAKGCWNREIESNLKTQLAERYLRGNQCHFGIYLVGWFKCRAWDKEDYRTNIVTRFNTKDDLMILLKTQAESLVEDGVIIHPYILDITIRD